MAVETGTVQVVMPAMGDSVAEGTVLEWHKQEGDTIAADETLVEISTDKVDAEVPSPVAGTVVKIHAAEGDTVAVGALLAEIAVNGAGVPVAAESLGDESGRTPAEAMETEAQLEDDAEQIDFVDAVEAAAPAPQAAAPAAAPATGKTIDIVTPTGGESVTEGTILEWSVKVGDTVKDGDTVVEISTDKVDMELPAPASGTITEILFEEGATVTVGQVIARMTTARARRPPAPLPRPPAEPAAAVRRRPDDRGRRDGGNASPVARRVAAERGHRPLDVAGTARGGRITKADVLAAAGGGNGGPATPGPRRRSGRSGRPAAQGRRRRARAVHGREPLDPDRDLVPHAHRDDARRAAQAAQGRRPEGLVHAPDRVRDRARRRPRTCR